MDSNCLRRNNLKVMALILNNTNFILRNGSFRSIESTSQASVVTTNLSLYLDAGNTTSYPGSGSTWFDISGNGSNATLTAATAGVNAIIFNRSNNTRAVVSPSLNLSTTPTITINMWVKFASLPTLEDFHLLAELSTDYAAFSDAFYVAIGNESSINKWFAGDNGNAGFNIKNLISPSPVINTWYNFTVIYDHTQAASNERTFYIDGVNQTNIASTEGGVTFNSDNTNNFGNRPLYIGGRSTTSFSSNMDLGVFQIYTTALSSTQVTQNYNALKDRYGL